MAAVNFSPLKPLFLLAYQSAHVYVPANPSLPPLRFNVRRNPDVTELSEVLPRSAFTLIDIKANELAEAYRFFGRGNFGEALSTFRTILQKILLVVVTSEADVAEVSLVGYSYGFHTDAYLEVKDIVKSSREHVIGLTMETERRRLVAENPDNVTRNLELAAYFTHCQLPSSHVRLALRSAMGVFAKAGNHATAAVFARRLIDTSPSDTKVLTQVG